MKKLLLLVTSIISISSFASDTYISCKAIDSELTVQISDATDEFGLKVIQAKINHPDIIGGVLETPKHAEVINRDAGIYALNFNTKLNGKRLMVEFLYDRDGLMDEGRKGKTLKLDYYYVNNDPATIIKLNCDELFGISY